MVKYAFGFPVVAMVSHIPVKSRIPGNDVTTKLGFRLFKRFTQVIRDAVSARQLLQNGAHDVGNGLLLVGKEVVVQACYGDIFLLCPIAYAIDH